MRKKKFIPPLSYKEFEAIILRIKDECELASKLHALKIDVANRNTLAPLVTSLLSKIFEDAGNLIDYYVWDCDFGKRWEVYEKDGKPIIVATLKDFYDLLCDDMKARKL